MQTQAAGYSDNSFLTVAGTVHPTFLIAAAINS